uniref:hypothetical protein n=1 Tax=Stenotrophomonas maltophilia TaxID=40324 RepID=UPI0019540782
AALESTAPDDAGASAVLYTDALLEVLVHREPLLGRQLAERYLGPLADSPELLATLRAHLANDLALTATALALGVHKN